MAYSEAIGSDNSTYHFQPSGAGYTASNPTHDLMISISEQVLTISSGDDTWQLASNDSANDFIVSENRLTIHRDGFDEWYVNGPLGLQQGFTLYEPVTIAFEVGGTLATTASAQSLSLGNSLSFSGLMAYDANGQNVPVQFEFEDNRLAYAYDDRGAQYPVTIDPWVQAQTLMASDAGAGDNFGISVALYGNTALIGAYQDDCAAGIDCGSAYVFERLGMTWVQQQKLTASDASSQDRFGWSVALSGISALVGAYSDDCIAGNDCGSAYVFVRSGTTWSQQAKLTASDAAGGDYFGRSVALYGNTALIGARGDDCTLGLDCGAVYAFHRSNSSWTQQQKIIATSYPDSYDNFGSLVALDGNTAVISAPGANLGDGGVYVFVRSGGLWIEQDMFSGAYVEQRYGASIALSGDTVIVGAPGGNGSGCFEGDDCGEVFIYIRSGTSWLWQGILGWSSLGDFFGAFVRLDGDTALITGGGNTYVATRSGGTWSQQQIIPYSGPLALDGDIALIGRPGQDCGAGIDCGEAIVYVSNPLVASGICNGPNLEVTITAGDGPFNITASAGINTPVNGVTTGMTTITGPEKWDNLSVRETLGGLEVVNLGTFKCRTTERPVPVSPAHSSRTTNPFPLFTWTGITDANNYRLFVFDNDIVANRTVDIRENSGGPTSMTLSVPLPNGRLYWRLRGRQNRLWSLWSIRFTLFKDPPLAAPMTLTTPVPLDAPNVRPTLPPPPPPTIPPSSDGAPVTPTLPPPPNSR